jgi:hypothetical protein
MPTAVILYDVFMYYALGVACNILSLELEYPPFCFCHNKSRNQFLNLPCSALQLVQFEAHSRFFPN